MDKNRQSTIGLVLDEILGLKDRQSITVRKENNLYIVETQNDTHIPFISVKINPCDRVYGIITIPNDMKGFFPGYKNQFILKTDLKPFIMHMSAGNEGAEKGSEDGNYLCHPYPRDIEDQNLIDQAPDSLDRIEGSFKRWYEEHDDIGRRPIRIYRITSRYYNLEIPDNHS